MPEHGYDDSLEDWLTRLRSAAQEVDGLLDERQALSDKNRLEYIRWALDRIRTSDVNLRVWK